MDDFSDDDLDNLNPLALQQLEENAIQFTQAAQAKPPQTQAVFSYDDFEYDDLDDAIVQDDLRGTSAISPQRLPQPYLQQAAAPAQSQHGNWALPKAGGQQAGARHPTQLHVVSRPSQKAALAAQHSRNGPQPPPPISRPAPSIPARYQATQAPPRQNVPTPQELATLQAQILDLQTRLSTKDGEIQIVRSRLEKSALDHDREMQNLKKQSAEQLAKFQRAAEAANAARESAATELQFTRQDLRSELDKARTTRTNNAPTTPRKNAAAKSWGVADGFEDVEMASSPTRGRSKHAGPVATMVAEPKGLRTPTKNKRKRPALDSPVMELEMESEGVTHTDDVESKGTMDYGVRAVPHTPMTEYLKIILNHRSARDRQVSFDYLAGFVLPSRPSESLAARLLQKLGSIGASDDPSHLPVEFCKQIIQMWRECLKEACLAPIAELVSIVFFTVQLNTVDIAPRIASLLLPIALDSCYEVAIPRFHHAGPGDPVDASWKNFHTHVPCTEIMSLLYLVALGCATSDSTGDHGTAPIVDFWAELQLHFMLMWLSQKHPVEEFCIALRILSTSVFPDNIGPRDPVKTPEEVAGFIIDRVSMPLIEAGRWDIEREELHEVRILILRTLVTFATTSFGYVQLVASEYAIPRLVALLSACIDELYEGSMQYTALAAEETGAGSPRSLHLLVDHAIFVLHTIMTNPLAYPGRPVDAAEKLRGHSGSLAGVAHKYTLSLARINYSENLVSEETAEMAHELLDVAVTREQAEELSTFFDG